MLIDIGEGTIIQKCDMIFILDKQVYQSSSIYNQHDIKLNDILKQAKSVVITSNGVHYSALAPQTIKRRAYGF
ncbi:extracellular matrix/biofilm biosynthesis regulator RemA family protein [Bacillus sp. CGMCC 1.16541]|uniref:extracellular matrix regulator RemB n=1 Tax=Bacillus sp. CGMCC 1.16541 TaxID=2185143 RepID=UPI000D738530|nr:extracellular matrix/biofilm biosynthesis regulator RemA family protein [Bacillus sp. CGMCC 1.16541]